MIRTNGFGARTGAICGLRRSVIMTMQHLTPKDYITTKRSGGLTTQLGIAPEGAVYTDRDFL